MCSDVIQIVYGIDGSTTSDFAFICFPFHTNETEEVKILTYLTCFNATQLATEAKGRSKML